MSAKCMNATTNTTAKERKLNLGKTNNVGVSNMLKSKMIALTATLAFVVMALPASAADITLVGGDISPQSPSGVIVLSNTWRIETTEMTNTWAWSIQCTGCTILGINMNNAFGNPPSPPSTPGGQILWQAPGYGVIAGTLPGYVSHNGGTWAGSIGGTTAGAAFTGNGLNVLVAWVTVHVTASSGSVAPFFAGADGILNNSGPALLPTTMGAVTWAPEPGTAMLLALGMGGLGIMGRRNR
jgi:hypothetical protein